MDVDGVYNNETAGRLNSVFDDVSGVMAAGILLTEQKAVIYANDFLSKNDIESAADLSGFGVTVLTEDYVTL